MCQIWSWPVITMMAAKSVARAAPVSARIMIARRFRRSTTAPASGDSRMAGSLPKTAVTAKGSARPVVS
jgi:hypothetical protein